MKIKPHRGWKNLDYDEDGTLADFVLKETKRRERKKDRRLLFGNLCFFLTVVGLGYPWLIHPFGFRMVWAAGTFSAMIGMLMIVREWAGR